MAGFSNPKDYRKLSRRKGRRLLEEKLTLDGKE